MKNKTFYLFLILSFVFCFAVGAIAGMESENYRIPTSVMSGGGAPMSSDSYQTNSTVGQSSPLMNPADPPYSDNYDLYPGFWYTIETAAVDLCEGDFEPDGDVDGSDLAVFAADFGRTDCGTGEPCEGDFDNDNDVDGSDLAVFAADFGRTDCPH
jgi:hypothetical protein